MDDTYKNQADVDKVKKMLESISPGLRISYYMTGHEFTTVQNIGLYVPEKGNKEVINKLLSIGFKKIRRRKVEDGGYWNMSATYTMQVVLEISIEKAILAAEFEGVKEHDRNS